MENEGLQETTNVVVFLVLPFLKSLVLAQVDHTGVGPCGDEQHAVLRNTHQPVWSMKCLSHCTEVKKKSKFALGLPNLEE